MLSGKPVRAVALLLFATGSFTACEKDDPEEVTFQSISGFVISEQGTKLLATDQGLYALNEENGHIEFMEGENKHTPLNDLAHSMTNPGQELWLASDAWAYNFTLRYYLTRENSGLHNNRVNHLHFNDRQGAFFATPEGLSIQAGTAWTNYPGLDDLYLDFEITDMGTASNGYTYVTTYGGGIERFMSDVDGISGATIFDSDWTLLESNHIHTVFIDDTTQVYGTDKGVAMHLSEYTKWDWKVYTTSDGLIHDTVLAVVKDHSGFWWFGTPRGISRFDESSWTSYTSQSHDIISNHILFLAVDTDGSVWMAAEEGLSQFIDEQWVSYPK